MNDLLILLKKFLFLLSFTLTIFSCAKDNLAETIILLEEDPNININEDPNTQGSINEPILSPCSFELGDIQPNTELIINCVLDLEGETINLPENVSLIWEGGEINNGTIIFNNGKIDGKLLNINLNIEGQVNLINPIFNFNKKSWNITEGLVSIEIAVANKNNLNKCLNLVHMLGATRFNIDSLDAFFYGKRFNNHPPISYEENSIKIPSNLHFSMSDNTFLRVQPSNNPFNRLITTFKSENIKITGGTLVGDRYEHDYSPIADELGVQRNTHEFGCLLLILGSSNIIVDNINIENNSGDGLAVQASAIRNIDGSTKQGDKASQNVLIKNCKISGNRRNNISVTDGNYVTIEQNLIENAGGGESTPGTYSSSGVDPQFGIDLEAYRERKSDGSLYQYEKVENVFIKNNTFTNNHKGDIVVFTADYVTIENNKMDGNSGIFAGHDISFLNNTFNANDNIRTSIAIGFNEKIIFGSELTYNVVINNNSITGYETSVQIGSRNVQVSGNEFNDFKQAILLTNIKDAEMSDNIYQSNRDVSWGVLSIGGVNAENIKFSRESINVGHRPLNFFNTNENLQVNNANIIFDNCTFIGNRKIYINTSKNISIKNSLMKYDIETYNSSNIILLGNIINNSL